ncbi:hypothetical protein PUN28_012806 [Cardiocondyla obscurior]
MINETATSLVDSDTVIYTPIAHNYDNETEILTLPFDDELSIGIYNLTIQYVGILNNDLYGFFRTSYVNENGNKVWLAASHFEPTWARRAFPCWDEPALKATFNISIKHHRNYTAVSNMPILDQSDDEDDTMWTHFDTTPLMSTYLVAFVVSDYVQIPNEDKTLNMWCRSALARHSKFAQEIALKAREILTRYTNTTVKVPKMDHLAVPQLTAGAMENWGLIIYNENNFAYNEKKDTRHQKMRVAITAAHEMAHQWFGNVVSPRWWSHVWLNEGFASFFEEYVIDEIFKDWRIMDFFVIETQQSALQIDIARNMKPITFEVNQRKEINSLFSDSSYGKAPAILRMLQHIVTPDVFRNGIIKYLHKHQFSTASSDDLWNALQAALDESDISHNSYKLKEVMDSWLKQRHYPVVRVNRNWDTGEITLTQEHFRSKNASERVDSDKWWIPLTFATQTNPDFSNTLPTYWLRPQDKNITIEGIDPNDWIIVNVQQIGYFRVNYDDSSWKKIANYLNSDNYTKIHVLNRASIIDDAYHFLITHQLDINIFLELANYLSQEIDLVALYPMFNILEFTQGFYNFPETDYYKQFILNILDKLIKSVGYEEDPVENNLTKLKRAMILRWACNFGHSECKKTANVKLNEYIANPETYRVPSDLKHWTYCNGIKEANISTWNKLMDMYLINHNADILEYLTCSENPDILISFINKSALNDSIIQKNYYSIISSIIQYHSEKDAVLNYMLENLKIITPKETNEERMLTGIIYSVYSLERLDKIRDFVESKFEGTAFEDLQRTIERRKSKLISIFNKFSSFIIKENNIL